MTTIVRHRQSSEEACAAPDAFWTSVAARTHEWLAALGIDPREVIVLLPFMQLLPLARRAFGGRGVWLPRIETTRTLSAALGPPADPEPGQISLDPTLDHLVAAQVLRSRDWGHAWQRRDPQGFERAVASVVQTAHALLGAAAALPPTARAAHWADARALLPPLDGPGATERLLALVALEWASLAPPPATDRLFELRPAAWVVVQAGGEDPSTVHLLAASAGPALLIDADAGLPLHCGGWPAGAAPPTLAVCDGFEQEAQSAAAQIVEHLRNGEAPVALIAQDRLLVRRIRALLERDSVVIHDETGWKLSTTRAAAFVMALLRAARPDASSDAVLDWLKAVPQPERSFAVSLDAFEAWLRHRSLTRVVAVDAAAADEAARASQHADGGSPADSPTATGAPAALSVARRTAFWSAASAVLRRLAGSGQRPLPDWIRELREALIGCGAWSTLLADDAGRRVVSSLRLLPEQWQGTSAWSSATNGLAMSLAGFTDWVDRVLEQASFAPTLPTDSTAEVVVTPLARAMLRPFAAIVFPGADDKHFAGIAGGDGLLGQAQAAALGIAGRAARRDAELAAFAQLLRAPRIAFFRRRVDGAEPMAQSPWLARLALALASAGSTFGEWQDPRVERVVAATPIRASAPAAADRLPERLSATTCEALRACPYRFFALNLLRLGDEQELDGEVEKRDYGNWLHAVLYAFHVERAAPADAAEETGRLFAIAESSLADQGIAAEDFVPFAASFASFAPRYIGWLHARDRAGWRWSGGEIERLVAPEGLGGVVLRGFIDRIDTRTGRPGPRSASADDSAAVGDAQAWTELIDYKTGRVEGFRAKVAEPLEDTQLAFYAALVMPTGTRLKASYLALDGTQGIDTVEHPEVEVSAVGLLRGLAHDLARIRSGVGLPALGAGAACDFCAARGICRRDHWSAAVAGGVAA